MLKMIKAETARKQASKLFHKSVQSKLEHIQDKIEKATSCGRMSVSISNIFRIDYDLKDVVIKKLKTLGYNIKIGHEVIYVSWLD